MCIKVKYLLPKWFFSGSIPEWVNGVKPSKLERSVVEQSTVVFSKVKIHFNGHILIKQCEVHYSSA
jgi:hypothetical protein